MFYLVRVFSVTPPDYEPPGFVSSEKDTFDFQEEPMNIKVGDVFTVRSGPIMLTPAMKMLSLFGDNFLLFFG